MLHEFWSDVRYRLRALVRGGAMDRDLDAELRAHLEHQADAYERAGVPRAEALRRARFDFGGLERMKEETRDARGTRLVESLLQDARYTVRTLHRQPSFTLTMIPHAGSPTRRCS